MPGGSQTLDPQKNVQVATLALRDAYPAALLSNGLRITVYEDPTAINNATWVYTTANGWQRESDYVNSANTSKTRYEGFAIGEHSAVTSGSDIVVSSDEIADGEAVTIEFIWAGKDDDTNTGCGGLFLSTWTKAAGTLQKVADTEIVDHNDIGGTITVSTSDSAGSIALQVAIVSATSNFSYSGYVRLLFRKAT